MTDEKQKKKDIPTLGDALVFCSAGRLSMEFVCTGVFGSIRSENMTIYADFDGNEGDVWEYDYEDLYSINGSVLEKWNRCKNNND